MATRPIWTPWRAPSAAMSTTPCWSSSMATHQRPPRAATAPPNASAPARTPIEGEPDREHVSTCYVERQNLTMRMQMRRFTRLTNAFSKKLDNHIHALALYFVFYNFCRIHKTLQVPRRWRLGSQIGCGRWKTSPGYEARRPSPRNAGPTKKGAASNVRDGHLVRAGLLYSRYLTSYYSPLVFLAQSIFIHAARQAPAYDHGGNRG